MYRPASTILYRKELLAASHVTRTRFSGANQNVYQHFPRSCRWQKQTTFGRTRPLVDHNFLTRFSYS